MAPRGTGSDSISGEAGNVEPSAHYSDGDDPDRLHHGSGRAGAGKSRSRQEPFPDFLRYMQRLPQESAGPVEERPAFIVAGLSAPALHDRQRNGLPACRFPYLQRRRRPALPAEGSVEAEGRSARPAAGRKAGSTRPVRPQATAGRTGDGAFADRTWRGETAR